MASLRPDKDRTSSRLPSLPRRARSSSKSPSPHSASALTTIPTDASSGISTTTTSTTVAETTDGTTPSTPTKKKKRARRPVVKTTPQYMTESDQESESIPPPEAKAEPEVEPETNGVSGLLITETVAQEEPVQATTPLFEERREGLPHIDRTDPYAIVIPQSSMLRTKLTTSISSSPASSPRVKHTTTSSTRTQEVKMYTPRRRKLLESESETEMEPEVDTMMEQGDATGVESEPTEPVRRNLVLGHDSDEKEVGDEPVETPDWTFKELTADGAATIDKPSPGSSSAHSPKQTSQKEQQGRMRKGKEVEAADVLAIKTTNRRRSTGKMPTSQAPEQPILVAEVPTTNMPLTESRAPLTSGATVTQKQDDPIFMEEVRTTNRLLRKSNAPFIFQPTSTVMQQDQERLSASKESSPGSDMESDAVADAEEAAIATPPRTTVDKSPIQAEEMKKYQQHFRFYERKKPYRQVDYVHVYDWMSPAAPVRMANNHVQKRIDKLSSELKSMDQTQELRCPKCANDDLGTTSPKGPGCSDCKRLVTDAKTERGGLKRHNKSIMDEIQTLRIKQHPVPPTIFQSRCHWCGIRISDDSLETIEEQFVGDRVRIKDVENLPVVYEFDHEQKRLCIACSYDCGVLLKAKRKFQLLYELSARIQPQGCVNCGIRESDRFRADTGHVGLLCSVCGAHKEQNGLDRRIPKVQMRIEELRKSIVSNSVNGAIRWDRIANDSHANPNFEYSAHGLLHRWVQYQKMPEQPSMSTYILLQHNHLTRKSPRSQLYTCHASTPTQAALYFSRFVALYKKQPMTYLYIRKLETWNIPASRPDDWEDLSSGLQTFEELKQRIRESVLEEGPKQLTKDEIWELYCKMFPVDRSQVPKYIPPGDHANWKERLFELLSGSLNMENQHLLQQLHFDQQAWDQYFIEWVVPRVFFAEVAKKVKASKPTVASEGGEGSAKKAEVDFEVAGFDGRTMDALVEEKQGLIRSSTGLGFVPLDPPEPRFKQLPEWAQDRARKVHRQAIQDERLNHIHQRHLFYESVGETKPKDALGFDLDLALKDAAAALFEFCTTHGYERSLEDCVMLVHKARKRGGDAEMEPATDPHLSARAKRSRLQKIFVNKIMEIEKLIHANGVKTSLPSAHDPTPMPSAQVPTHLVPAELQVHVYQAVLTAETRTVDVRLVRTERYKRQGDCLAGGAPIQVPKIINREALRGFYREADRAKRYVPVANNKSDKISDTTIVLKADKGGSGLSGVETWKEIDLDTMITLGVAEPIPPHAANVKGIVLGRYLAEARKPEVLKRRRAAICEALGLPRKDVQILDERLYQVSRELSENSTGQRVVGEVLGQKRRRSEDTEMIEDGEMAEYDEMSGGEEEEGGESVEGYFQSAGASPFSNRSMTSSPGHKRARSGSSEEGFQTAEEMSEAD
ncbi:hypothetical protein BKA57DRAFT_321495 [Linnemannia elongata]|nr:hypothetical protein BKA57DRAFT_321495 [Linnemannia elongata]